MDKEVGGDFEERADVIIQVGVDVQAHVELCVAGDERLESEASLSADRRGGAERSGVLEGVRFLEVLGGDHLESCSLLVRNTKFGVTCGGPSDFCRP